MVKSNAREMRGVHIEPEFPIMDLEYVLITPAHNEEQYIEKAIQSMLNQTILPKRWVIVSDGSSDGTENIVGKYLKENNWIELIKRPQQVKRDFASKVYAFNVGFETIKKLEFDIIGNLDADISFDSRYFEYLLSKFAADPKLGVAGTDYLEGTFHSFNNSYINMDHVNGQCQLFRRECFVDIGGYAPISMGGIDWVAVTTARMRGWKTHSFSDHIYMHHRAMGTGSKNGVLMSRLHYGKKDYFLGGHPLWELCRVCFQMTQKPYVVGGLFLLLGYAGCWLAGAERPISKELMDFHRSEQLARLRSLLSNRLSRGR